MAEERFIDDDKDRKYRIRINEAGEEELEILENPEEEEPQEESYETGLEIPEFEEDDEEAADMTPEQLFKARKAQEEERAASIERAQEFIKKAEELYAEGKTEYALTSLDSAQKENSEAEGIYPLKLKILSKNFTSLSRLEECIDAAEGHRDYSTVEEKREISEKFSPVIERELEEQKAKNKAMYAENEGKKSERRVRFKAQLKKSVLHFALAFVPFLIFLCLGIGYSTIMFADRGGLYLILTIVFFALAAAMLIVSLILSRPLARDARRLRVNERDTSTAIGRAYLEGADRAGKLEELYSAIFFKGTVVSQNPVYAAVQEQEEE